MAKFSSKDPLTKLKALFLKARDAYYNSSKGETIMSDEEFDELEEIIREREPNWIGLKSTGIKTKKFKTKLDVPMASLDKVKIDSVGRWIESRNTQNAVLSDKLDGSSLQLKFVKGKPVKLVTRGDGVVGGDISFLIPHLKIPQSVGNASVILRCEGLFSKSAFQKYKSEFDAARNAASGIFNRQDVHKGVKDLSIMVLKVMDPPMKPSQGLAWAKSKGFLVVPYRVVPFAKLNGTNLTKLLDKRKLLSKYQLDGIVIEEDKVNRMTKDKPDWAKAFKSNISAETAPTTTIRKVHWDVSHRGQIIPRVEFDAVEFEGAKIKFASAFNAKYVTTNGIGVGGKIKILRSGDIIPFIAQVVKAVKPDQPDVREVGEYKLDKNGTNYVLTKPADSEAFRLQRMLKFFNTLEVDFMRIGTITKLYQMGFTNIKSIVNATPDKFVKKGMTEASATKIYNAIQAKTSVGVPLIQLMDASGTFPHGMGQTRFEKIAAAYDLEKILLADPDLQERYLMEIPGFANTTISSFIKGAPKFLKWLEVTGLTYSKPKKAAKVKLSSQKLSGLGISWTGYRNKGEEETVVKNGGQVVPFGGKTNVLLVSPNGKASTKEDKAAEKGLPVLTWDKFARKYGV